jgi:hypothetical protein
MTGASDLTGNCGTATETAGPFETDGHLVPAGKVADFFAVDGVVREDGIFERLTSLTGPWGFNDVFGTASSSSSTSLSDTFSVECSG